MLVKKLPDIYEKLTILTTGAKYDVSCASSGVNRKSYQKKIGNTSKFGICHSWSSDGRCISLLKILLTNFCNNDCAYCINRKRNDIPRTLITPDELARLTYEFYRRNYIEGLFLSSGIIGNPDRTMEMMIKAVKILRLKYGFNGYIHLKIIPYTSESAMLEAIRWADRVSINIELPNQNSLKLLAPEKDIYSIIKSMNFITQRLEELREKNTGYNCRGGQSTQIIIGATPDSDYDILKLSFHLYKKNKLKRVYYSGYIPVNQDCRLPDISTPPLLREHRLYQADWLIRFYGFNVDEIVSEKKPYLDESIDPKLDWALRNMDFFPVEISKASLESLLRVPGIGPTSALRIVKLRKFSTLDMNALKKIGVVVKRAKYFITLNGKYLTKERLGEQTSDVREYLIKSENNQYCLTI